MLDFTSRAVFQAVSIFYRVRGLKFRKSKHFV